MKEDTNIIGKPGLIRHFAAMFYDAWLILASLFLTVAVMIGLRFIVEGSESMPKGQIALGGYWRYPTFIVMVLVVVHFYGYFWVKNGQTLGMQAWRIRLDNNEHKHINWKQAYIRCAVALFSLSLLGLGYLWRYIDKDQCYWHDKASQTRLVLLAKRQ